MCRVLYYISSDLGLPQKRARYALSSVLSSKHVDDLSILLSSCSPPSPISSAEDSDTDVILLLAMPSSSVHTELCEITKHSFSWCSVLLSVASVSSALPTPGAITRDCEHEVEIVYLLLTEPSDWSRFGHRLASSANTTASSMSVWSLCWLCTFSLTEVVVDSCWCKACEFLLSREEERECVCSLAMTSVSSSALSTWFSTSSSMIGKYA